MNQLFFDAGSVRQGMEIARQRQTRNAHGELAPQAIQCNQNALAELSRFAPDMAMRIQERADIRTAARARGHYA